MDELYPAQFNSPKVRARRSYDQQLMLAWALVTGFNLARSTYVGPLTHQPYALRVIPWRNRHCRGSGELTVDNAGGDSKVRDTIVFTRYVSTLLSASLAPSRFDGRFDGVRARLDCEGSVKTPYVLD